jgi:hypothetical protein
MLTSQKRGILFAVFVISTVALAACSGEIPPELLEAAILAESSGIDEFEIDLSNFADELEFIGEVQSISAGEWTIADLSFLVESLTEIKANPLVGDTVKVHASITSEGALLAHEIEPALGEGGALEDDDDAVPFELDNEFEFVGRIDAMDSLEWTIADRLVVILPMTEIEGVLNLGDLVKVHAFLNSDGELAAREIEPSVEGDDSGDFAFDLEHEFEFVGTVETLGSNTWTVAGRTIIVLPETEIKGVIVEGDLVKVHALLNPVGELAAREIEPAVDIDLDNDELDDDDDLKLVGILEQIGEDIWIVDGVEFRVTSDTEIEDAPSVGDLVEVYFFSSSDSVPLAREIEAEDDSEDALADSDDDDLDDDESDDLDDDDDDDDDHSDSDDDDDDDDDDDEDHSGSDDD